MKSYYQICYLIKKIYLKKKLLNLYPIIIKKKIIIIDFKQKTITILINILIKLTTT